MTHAIWPRFVLGIALFAAPAALIGCGETTTTTAPASGTPVTGTGSTATPPVSGAPAAHTDTTAPVTPATK